jgi:hypothetical protein
MAQGHEAPRRIPQKVRTITAGLTYDRGAQADHVLHASDEEETPGVSQAERLLDGFVYRGVRFAIYHFDGKITEVLKLLLQQDAKPTKEKHSVPLTVRLAPEVY